MSNRALAQKALEQGEGVFRLAPAWVPRSFCRPGRRLKLHPDDYYALGTVRGGIDERWLASTTPADNGPGTPQDEGLSYIVVDEPGTERILLIEAVRELGAAVIGEDLWKQYGRWPIFAKFFDNLGPLPHHIHHRDQHAALTGQSGKPEMYFFPSQMNNYPGEFAYTFFGVNPGVSKEQVRECLENFTRGDNRILELSRAYKLRLDTGWDVPTGLLHAPGSLCTYEPQFASDVYAMYQSVLFGDHCVPPELLWKNTPENRVGDYDLLMEYMDWDLNVDPDFAAHRFMLPKPARDPAEMEGQGYREEWICYRCPLVSAKRLMVYPGRSVVIRDHGAYGFILLEGYGSCNGWTLETPTLIRYGQLTNDEFFVTPEAAEKGLRITNLSKTGPLVLLKHFAGNPLPV